MFHFEWRYWSCYWNCWVTAKIRPIIDDVTKTAEHKIKKQEGGLLLPMMVSMNASFIRSMTFSLINAITGKGGKG